MKLMLAPPQKFAVTLMVLLMVENFNVRKHTGFFCITQFDYNLSVSLTVVIGDILWMTFN